jgi:hypothetical protein
MSGGAWAMLLTTVLAIGSLVFIIATMVKSIVNEKSEDRSILKDFGLSFVLMGLFFISWFAQGVAQWQTYTDEQREHNQAVSMGDFVSQFTSSTMENWQSEFLQLFSFVTLAALYIHKGSAESKDSDEKMEASLRRLEEKLGTLPKDAPQEPEEAWKLPDTPLKVS